MELGPWRIYVIRRSASNSPDQPVLRCSPVVMPAVDLLEKRNACHVLMKNVAEPTLNFLDRKATIIAQYVMLRLCSRLHACEAHVGISST